MSDINFDELTDKSFYFLVEEYSFKRKGDTYISDSAVIKIKYGRHQPHVTIKPVSEPDFTALGLNWFFDYYITNCINDCLEAQIFSELFDEFNDPSFFFGRPGYLGKTIKMFPKGFRF